MFKELDEITPDELRTPDEITILFSNQGDVTNDKTSLNSHMSYSLLLATFKLLT